MLQGRPAKLLPEGYTPAAVKQCQIRSVPGTYVIVNIPFHAQIGFFSEHFYTQKTAATAANKFGHMPLAITYTVPTRTRSDSQNISDVISQQSYNGYFLNFTSTSCYQLNGLFVFLCIKAVMTTMIYPKRCSTKIRLQMCSIVWFYVYQHLDINKFIVPVFLLF